MKYFSINTATFLISTFVLSVVGLGVPEAAAQEQDEELALEEVIVTAQRRDQLLSDVPVSITAFTSDDLRDLGYVDITQIASQTPNLNIKYVWGNSMPVFTIRGVGMNSFQASDTSSVGLYIDDVFQTSVVTMGAFLYDIDSVEVLKGPQGTLFGRNTNGGAVLYNTKAPSMDEAYGHARADWGSFDRVELEAAYGGPINEEWAGRISAMTMQQGQGWVFDRTSGTNIGTVDISAVRGQLLYQPAEDLSARLIMFASRDRSQPVYFQHLGTLDINNRRQLCPSIINFNRIDPTQCVDTLGYSDTDGDPYAGDYTNDFNTEINSEANLKNDNWGATLLVDKSMSGADFRSVTAFQTYDRFQPKESDATKALLVDFLFASEMMAASQEIRFASNTDGKFSWIVGAQVSYDEVEEKPDRIGYLDALGVRQGLRYTQERLNAGLYGQGVWQLADEWRLEFGGRVIYDDVDFFSFVYRNSTPNTPVVTEVPIAGCPDPLGVVDLACQLDDTAVTGKVGIDWSPNEDFMIYGSVSTGYKPGGFNGGLVTISALYLPFEEEEIFALETGFKWTTWNGRAQLDAAVFDYSYDGLQASTPREDPNTGRALTFLTNLETADITGAEASFRVALTENVELNLGASVLDTQNNDPGVNFNGPLGNSPRKLANAPETSFNAALGWNIPLDDGGNVRFFTDYSYEGDHFKQIVNIPWLEHTNQLWNARVTWTAPSGNFDVGAYVRNLTDEVYITDDLGAGQALGWGVLVIGMPRVWGLSANFRF